MAHKFIKKNGKYYRINSDKTQTEVLLKDGYFYWTLPDKIRVKAKLDNNLTDMDKSDSLWDKVKLGFRNFGHYSSMTENPAGYTSEGWKLKDDGNFENKPTKGSEQLRKINGAIGTTALAAYTFPLWAPGTVTGTAIGNAAGSMAIGTALEEGLRAIAGQSTGDIVSGKLQEHGVPALIADMARPEYYINPTGAVAKGVWNAGSKAVNNAAKYARLVKGRYALAHTPLASEKEVQDFVKNTMDNNVSGIPTSFYRAKGSRTTDFTPLPTDEFSGTIEGGLLVKPGVTTEMHINPTREGYFDIADEGWFKMTSVQAPKYGALQAGRFIRLSPKGTILTSDEEARNIPLVFSGWKWPDRLHYYLNGKTPDIVTKTIDHGYSTDIAEQFALLGKTNRAIITPSLNTRLPGLNIFGKGFEKYKSYFGKTDAYGNISFKDMTLALVEAWNREVAPEIGHYIDPITRTSQQLTLITK